MNVDEEKMKTLIRNLQGESASSAQMRPIKDINYMLTRRDEEAQYSDGTYTVRTGHAGMERELLVLFMALIAYLTTEDL